MWQNKKISVILPTYNERLSIRKCINDFYATGIVDEVVVVNNNAVEGTSEEVANTKALEIFEKKQGYGASIRYGFKNVTGDYIIVCEPDGTFLPKDILKLISYASDFSFVVGTRTAREFIWSGANMGKFLKWGNYFVAKLMEVLFNSVNLTDVGCTMRLIKKEALRRMEPYFSIDSSSFGLEMMLLACSLNITMVQLPVNYKERAGKSSVTGDKKTAFFLGLRMIWLILKYRFFKKTIEHNIN